MSSQLPIIDLKAWFDGDDRSRHELCAQVKQVCHETGFFYIINHGIPAQVSAGYLAMARSFFALPLDARQAIDKHHSAQFRGWEQLGSELTNNEVDYREQIDIGVERRALQNPEPYYMALVGPNQWPPEDLLPGFREVVSDYFTRLSAVAQQLLRLMSLTLGLRETHIEQVFGADS